MIPKAKSRMSEHGNGKKNIWTSIFFLWDYVLNQHYYSNTTVVFIVAVFFKKAAIIIAIHGQKHYTDN